MFFNGLSSWTGALGPGRSKYTRSDVGDDKNSFGKQEESKTKKVNTQHDHFYLQSSFKEIPDIVCAMYVAS